MSTSCFPITSASTACPSYAGSYLARAVDSLNGTGITSVPVFDVFINKTVNGYPGTLFTKLGCKSPWKPSLVRYSFAFLCEYYLNQPAFIGGDPGSASDCNTQLNGRLTSIASSTCQAFLSSINTILKDTTVCPAATGDVAASRDAFVSEVSNLCQSSIAVGDLNGGNTAINISSDPLESGLCGYGAYPIGNDTAGLVSAVDYCTFVDPKDGPCCYLDPAITTSLNTQHIVDITQFQGEKVPVYSTSCTVVVNRFFTPACSNVMGVAVGLILIIASGIIVGYGVRKQDPEAMKQTASGKFKEDTKWLSSWWRNSPLSNPAFATMRKKRGATLARGGTAVAGGSPPASALDDVQRPPGAAVGSVTAALGKNGYQRHASPAPSASNYTNAGQYESGGSDYGNSAAHQQHYQQQQQQQQQYYRGGDYLDPGHASSSGQNRWSDNDGRYGGADPYRDDRRR
ncbi:hypothetical protein DFJ73DRAFT_49373 [Zopfochytrium polystomum]|nr:hypothetical protein DFJ73DRAFT_49373 [Zopfochytrium polystomum]